MVVTFEEEKQKKRLEQLRGLKEENRARITAKKPGLPYLDLSAVPVDAEALITIEEARARTAELAIIQKSYKVLRIAVKDHANQETAKILEELKQKGYQISLFVVSSRSLEKAWEQYKTAPKAAKVITGKIEISELKKEIETFEGLRTKIETLPPTQTSAIAEILLAGGLKFDASDIHIEPETAKVRLRSRMPSSAFKRPGECFQIPP